MKIIIEVSGGCVSAVYADEQSLSSAVPVFVVDLDAAKIGEGQYCTQIEPEPITAAPDLVTDALTDGRGQQ